MSRSAIDEYAAAVRMRYAKATKSEKGVILKEFCEVTGFHRKSAIRVLRRVPQPCVERRGRPRTYGAEVSDALRTVWRASDSICSKRLAPFLPELVPILERHGELRCSIAVREQLMTLSAATIDRLLRPVRLRLPRRRVPRASSSTVVKGAVPIRTFSEWKGVQAGHLQVDLVAHCGGNGAGFYLYTLVAIDVATGWTECVPVWGKSQSRVGGGTDRVRRCLPFPLRGLHSDNGSEFLNHPLVDYCQRHQIEFTRGRPYKKNDQAYVEQRNWQVVRRLIGYDRYATKQAYNQLAEIYWRWKLYVNYFQPMSKLISTERVGAKVRKHYDRARTPYQRLLEAKVLDEKAAGTLAQLYQRVNPVRLLTEIEDLVRDLRPMMIADPLTKEILKRNAEMFRSNREPRPQTAG